MDTDHRQLHSLGEGEQPGCSATKSGADTKEPCAAPLSPPTVFVFFTISSSSTSVYKVYNVCCFYPEFIHMSYHTVCVSEI